MLNVETLCVGELEANCHIVSDTAKNCVLIDPGAEAHYIRSVVDYHELKPLAILLTHGHFDHFGAAADLMRAYSIPLYVHALDEKAVRSPQYSLANDLGFAESYQEPEGEFRNFEEGTELKFSDELVFKVLHTPGHTPGGCCFQHGNQLFTGDTLFRDGVGRVDFPGGNIHDMRASLLRLGRIKGDCIVYCGHYGNTTLEHERTCGHYLTPHNS